jgi:anti-sigma-K factor RskA
MNYERPELLDKLSGAYVLGTMSARARPRFARLLAESAAAQRAVARWHDDLAPLNAAVPAMAPPPEVWRAIAASTGAAPATAPARSWWRGWLDNWTRPALAFGLGIALTSIFVSTNAPMLGMHHMDAALPASAARPCASLRMPT